ncbi:MAG: hypothetical protein DME11_01020 [Candidatus Rokuibacteriota bacterium]|nr:MAG: hypothetical protein DME11_01020 [Candidatus Rokubacteria bacterium]
MVGVNTAILSPSGGSIGIGFAIPSNLVKRVAELLIAGQKVTHPYLGVSVTTASSNGGAVISQLATGSPADKAGLRRGDVIVEVGKKPVADPATLFRTLAQLKPGDRVLVFVQRPSSGGRAEYLVMERSRQP